MPKQTSIYSKQNLEEVVGFCRKFRDFIAVKYSPRHGSVKRFADAYRLDRYQVYRQLNGTDTLKPEMRKIMEECMADG